MSALLTLKHVTAGYVADIDILRSVDVSVTESAITGLIGLNGAGKSTIMKTICGFLRPKSGAILFDGRDITGIAPHRVIDNGIYYIPQESSLFPYMSVDDNLRLPLEHLSRSQGSPIAGEIAARFEDMYAEISGSARAAPRQRRRPFWRAAEDGRVCQGLSGAPTPVLD